MLHDSRCFIIIRSAASGVDRQQDEVHALECSDVEFGWSYHPAHDEPDKADAVANAFFNAVQLPLKGWLT